MTGRSLPPACACAALDAVGGSRSACAVYGFLAWCHEHGQHRARCDEYGRTHVIPNPPPVTETARGLS